MDQDKVLKEVKQRLLGKCFLYAHTDFKTENEFVNFLTYVLQIYAKASSLLFQKQSISIPKLSLAFASYSNSERYDNFLLDNGYSYEQQEEDIEEVLECLSNMEVAYV